MAGATIKNIIFDLGGVFLDVDYQRTKQAFVDMGIVNFDDFYQQSFSNPLFAQLERGLVTPEMFYDHFREATATQLSNEEIKGAWNAMLGSFIRSSVAILPLLKKRYNTYLLSNTNAIHYQAFNNIHQLEYGNLDFDFHFHKTYYSHLFHERKPETLAYEIILRENNLKKEETLFVDDTEKNVAGAKSAGVAILHLKKGELVENALKQFILF